MLVYGDAARREPAGETLARVADALARAEAAPPGLARHSTMIEALIESGELAQGIADRDFHAAGAVDRASPQGDAAMALTMAIARRCALSWSSRFAACGAPVASEIGRCAALLPAGDIEVKQPEGYAFYQLYPESAFVAAAGVVRERWQVIGVRSIGTSLACMVAAGLGAPQPITVRPFGDPFARSVAADPSRIDRAAGAYALVDEGPGLSGSSLAAVARWLLDAGIGEDRLHFFASHRHGPGPQADGAIRALWRRATSGGRVHVTTFDDLVLHAEASEHRLENWIAALSGPLQAPLREIGGGAWRDLQARSGGAVAPSHPWQERRKFLALAGGTHWLVKFNGLGAAGLRKLAVARALARAGFAPEPLGCVHGFLVERWQERAQPLPRKLPATARACLLERVGGYLGFRARQFEAPSQSGASIEALAAMGRCNSIEALGPDAASAWDGWSPHLAALAGEVRRVATDNRMHAWEWLRCGTEFVKTDAIDHHAGHDLIGCQDIAWDIAGATVELDLMAEEERRLATRVGELSGRAVAEPLVRFFAACYPAFQLGYYDDAARSAADAPSAEAVRLRALRDRYAERLRQVLASTAFTPRR